MAAVVAATRRKKSGKGKLGRQGIRNVGALMIRIGLGIYSTIDKIGNPQNPTLRKAVAHS